jgi:hypothetical protein
MHHPGIESKEKRTQADARKQYDDADIQDIEQHF